MSQQPTKVRVSFFPTYARARLLAAVLDGVPRSAVLSLTGAIVAQQGTPQNQVDWTNPDEWIPERLSGTDAELALRIWHESGAVVNPRHIYGAFLLLNRYALLATDSAGVYHVTDAGRAFMGGDPVAVREIDEAEGVSEILRILSTRGKASRPSDLMPEWTVFLTTHSKRSSPSSVRSALHLRLANLLDRGLVSREGGYYTATADGMRHVAATDDPSGRPHREAAMVIAACNKQQRNALRERLTSIDPFRFEHLVCSLLEAMGYEDVTVTRQSGDKGVDVVATVQFGITTITEVVQVKRYQGNISRPVLDQLRGALPYHKALRGTIITLGKFSPGCKDAALYPGAAPIGLIDGDRLLDLLFEHEIGVRKRGIALYEVDEQSLASLAQADDGSAADA